MDRGNKSERNNGEIEAQRQDQRYDNHKPRSPESVIQINRLYEGLTSDTGNSWTIYPVPNHLSVVYRNAFEPRIISIGPHYYKYRLERTQMHVMEKHKKRFLVRLLGGKPELRRSNRDMPTTSQEERVDREFGKDLMEAMKLLEQETRACYSSKYQIDSNDFVAMMVLDGCFVVELLRLYYELFHTKSTVVANEVDPIFTHVRILTNLQRDLLMLANQLPFFVLEKLFMLINKKNTDPQDVPLEVLAVTFFNPLLPQQNVASKLNTKNPKAHLLDVFHSTFLESVSEKVHKKGKDQIKPQLNPDGSIRGLALHFASDLQEAGVKFRKREGHDLLDIKFAHGTLWVPPLSINENTVSLLLNFIAYELRVNHRMSFFTNYLMFWESLVYCPGDIRTLHKRGIINHVSGSEEDMANLLIKCRQVINDLDLGYLYDIIEEVNEYSKRYYTSKYRVWWRSLIREHFRSPWTCLSLFAAIIIVLLTFLQTLYAMYSYYRPR
ncbi:hypothetical protein ACJRO7_015817 [Eucalyptus globulus]|uniref:Uncharacterized protein n=1 Tax=Eucalyptus globulus TaxID=34317 RepID=A0ABD3L502_EUCGL